MSEPATTSLAALQALTGAGYNYYRDTSRQRADDLLVRSQAGDAVCRAAARVTETAIAARRGMPSVTREAPFPDPALLAQLTQLRELQARLNALETRLRGPAALPDRDFSRLRASAQHCDRLVHLDAALIEAAGAPDLEHRIDAMNTILDARAALASWSPS